MDDWKETTADAPRMRREDTLAVLHSCVPRDSFLSGSSKPVAVSAAIKILEHFASEEKSGGGGPGKGLVSDDEVPPTAKRRDRQRGSKNRGKAV